MPFRIAAAAIAMFFGLTPLAARADDDRLEIAVVKNWVDGGDEYGVFFDANKVGATTCELQTPSNPLGFDCPFGLEPADLSGLLFSELTCSQLEAEGETGGNDWRLIWDEGLSSETVVDIDFGSIDCVSDWPTDFPTISDPLDGASGVSSDTSIDWTWPSSPVLHEVNVILFKKPDGERRDSGPLSSPTPPTSWTPDSPLSEGEWTAVVLNQNALRTVPTGLTITGDPWVLDNSTWLSAYSMDVADFNVGPVAFPVSVAEWSTTWSDPLLDGSGSPIVLSDDFEDDIIPSGDDYSFMAGMPLPGDETGGELILQHPSVNPFTGGLDEVLGWKVDEANRAAAGPVVANAVFTGELVLAPGEFYSLSIYSNDPLLPLPPQPPPYQVVLAVYVYDGYVFAGLTDIAENNAPIAYRLLGSHGSFAPNSVELQLELIDVGAGWLLPEGRVCIDGGSCETVDTTTGITPPAGLGAAPRSFEHGASFGVGYPGDAALVPSISFGGLAMLGGLVFAIAAGGFAVQRKRR